MAARPPGWRSAHGGGGVTGADPPLGSWNPGFAGAGDKDKSDQHIKVLDEVEQEFRLGMTIGETGECEFIAHMHYSRSFK